MSKRGLSREEKRTRMMDIFHETAEFFTLKELEKIAPKQKGIVQQSVKEILDELVSDGLVIFDKIGTSNYFWSFPSAASATKQGALDKATKESVAISDKITETRTALDKAARGREDTPERRKLLDALADARATHDRLHSELAAYGAADPVKYARKARAIETAKHAAVRWTDNTMVLFSFAKSVSPNFEEAALRGELGMNDAWDDLDTQN